MPMLNWRLVCQVGASVSSALEGLSLAVPALACRLLSFKLLDSSNHRLLLFFGVLIPELEVM